MSDKSIAVNATCECCHAAIVTLSILCPVCGLEFKARQNHEAFRIDAIKALIELANKANVQSEVILFALEQAVSGQEKSVFECIRQGLRTHGILKTKRLTPALHGTIPLPDHNPKPDYTLPVGKKIRRLKLNAILH